jgi:HNH endonuclease
MSVVGLRMMASIHRTFPATLACGKGRASNLVATRSLRQHAIAEPTRYRRLELDESTLRLATASSHSVAEVLRKLRLPVNETNRRRVLRGLGRHNIDTSHFRRQLTSTVIQQRTLDPEGILLSGRRVQTESRTVLRRAVILAGVLLRCSCCGIGGLWQGKPLILEVDHINGNYLDNRRENLRLCPNCHSQTETFAGRNRSPGRKPAVVR